MLANAANVTANAMDGYPEQTFPWPHLVPDYQNYSQFPNVNCWWSQFYYQQTTFDARGSFNSRQADYAWDESSISSFDQGNGLPTNTPTSSNHYIPPPFAPPPAWVIDSAGAPFPNCQFSQNGNGLPLPQQFPIRPVPQQASSEPVYQCHDCLRFCSSAGGLKRHARYCRASETNLQNLFSSLTQQPSNLSNANEVPLKQCEYAPRPSFSSLSYETPLAAKPPTLVITLSDSPSPRTPSISPSGEPSSYIPSYEPSSCNPQTPSTPASMPSPLTDAHNSFAETDASSHEEASRIETDERVPKGTELLNEGNVLNKQCQHCSLNFSSERALEDHLVSHNDKPYACLTCGSHFSRKFHLTRHVKQRGCDGKPRAQYPCEFCGKAFSRKDNLREHVKGHIGQARPRPKLPCPIPLCIKEFTSRVQLQTHINFHNGERPYACTYDSCDKRFRSNGSLRKHQRAHTVDKPYQCSQCNASFAVLETLTQHIATHISGRPEDSFVCQECPSKFSRESALRDHVTQRHQTEEEFSCSLCRRKYRRRWRLQQHYRLVHCEKRSTDGSKDSSEVQQTDELARMDQGDSLPIQRQTFTCDICQKGFVSRQSLKVHYLTHPVEVPISCPECNKGFVRRECLLRHLRSKHRMPTILAIQAIQAAQGTSVQSGKTATTLSHGDGLTNDVLSTGTQPNFYLPFQVSKVPTDTSALEANVIELLNLLVDSSTLKNFGWPEKSVDSVLRAVLEKCGREPASDESEPLVQRLRSNVKHLFSFIVDDQAALETLFARRPIEQVLEQVIQLAKSNDSNNSVVQLPL